MCTFLHTCFCIYVLVFREVLPRQKQLRGSEEIVGVKEIGKVGAREKVGVGGAAKLSIRVGKMQFLILD